MAPDKDPGLEKLNAQLRVKGSSPERDLWQGIEKAITVVEERLEHRAKNQSNALWRQQLLWAAAAVVAFALVLVPLDLQQNEKNNEGIGETKAPVEQVSLAKSEEALGVALCALENAARENPGNQNLSRLVRMAISRKGNLLRCKWIENKGIYHNLNGGIS